VDHYPRIAEIGNNGQVRENTFLDSHDLDHVRQVICGFLDIVLYLNIVIHNLVLQSQVFERLDHLLNFSSDFSRILVFKLLDCSSDTLKILT
jgi:hypothetical protein